MYISSARGVKCVCGLCCHNGASKLKEYSEWMWNNKIGSIEHKLALHDLSLDWLLFGGYWYFIFTKMERDTQHWWCGCTRTANVYLFFYYWLLVLFLFQFSFRSVFFLFIFFLVFFFSYWPLFALLSYFKDFISIKWSKIGIHWQKTRISTKFSRKRKTFHWT